jgi:hypothetical protein
MEVEDELFSLISFLVTRVANSCNWYYHLKPFISIIDRPDFILFDSYQREVHSLHTISDNPQTTASVVGRVWIIMHET